MCSGSLFACRVQHTEHEWVDGHKEEKSPTVKHGIQEDLCRETVGHSRCELEHRRYNHQLKLSSRMPEKAIRNMEINYYRFRLCK